MLDKRHWTTPAQHQWFQDFFPSYMEAQARGRYDNFWPKFFQEWFEKWPASEPRWTDPTDLEHNSDSDSEQTDAEPSPTTSK